MTIKETLYQGCEAFVNERLNSIQERIHNIQESLMSETKSSAGDKHETGRAMLQLEREKAGAQLAAVQKLKQILEKVNLGTSSDRVGLGSLVLTSQANYFIAISAGQLQVEQTIYYAISAQAPIGRLLMGKCVGDSIQFIGNRIDILSID